jgi:phage shock protein A
MAPNAPLPVSETQKLTPSTTTSESLCDVRRISTVFDSLIDKDQVDFDLSKLFIEEPVAATESAQACASLLPPTSATPTAEPATYDNDYPPSDDDAVGGAVFGCDLPFGVQVVTDAEDAIKLVSHERDQLKAEAAKYKKEYEGLQRKVCKRGLHDVDLPAEVVRRLERLERLETDVTRYLTENANLRDSLKDAETEVATLQDQIASQKNKLKGAGKKVRNAKDVAGKQEVKAKDAVREKQDRVSSERKMKQKCDKALAEVASLTKLCDDLQANLDIERAGRPHMRKGDSASDTVVAVIPVQIEINRAHFLTLSDTLEISRASVAMSMQAWYDDWKKPKEPSKTVIGADYVDDKKSDKVPVNLDKLFADMVEDGHQQTGAEHDGWRSKQSLDTICRKAEERHNTYGTL